MVRTVGSGAGTKVKAVFLQTSSLRSAVHWQSSGRGLGTPTPTRPFPALDGAAGGDPGDDVSGDASVDEELRGGGACSGSSASRGGGGSRRSEGRHCPGGMPGVDVTADAEDGSDAVTEDEVDASVDGGPVVEGSGDADVSRLKTTARTQGPRRPCPRRPRGPSPSPSPSRGPEQRQPAGRMLGLRGACGSRRPTPPHSHSPATSPGASFLRRRDIAGPRSGHGQGTKTLPSLHW